MQKITKILQNRLLKLQKFKNALILSQINEMQPVADLENFGGGGF